MYYYTPNNPTQRKGILTLFLFSNFGMIDLNHPFLTNLDLLQGRLTLC